MCRSCTGQRNVLTVPPDLWQAAAPDRLRTRYKLRMDTPEEGYTVEEVELSEYEMGFIAGVLAARGITGQPTEEQFRDAFALLMAQTRDLDS